MATVSRGLPDRPHLDVPKREARELLDDCRKGDADALARLADATMGVDVEHYVAQVRAPTLILAPAVSPLTHLADQLYLRTTIPGAQIEVFEGRGHTVYQDEPARCIARLRRFIADHPHP